MEESTTTRRESSARRRVRAVVVVLLIVIIVLLVLFLRPRDNPAPTGPPRSPTQRRVLLEKYKAPDQAEEAIHAALIWLTQHQAPDGSWGSDHATCPKESVCSDIARGEDYRIGLTGLVTLGYLARGVSDTPVTVEDPERREWEKRFSAALGMGIDFLVARQAEDGTWGKGHIYSQAIATMALVEASVYTSRKDLGPRIEKSIDFIARSQSAGGGWDYYGVSEETGDPKRSDTSIVAWACMALASADEAGYQVPDAVFAGIVRHLHAVTQPATQEVGYTGRGSGETRTCRAIGLLCRLFLGYDPQAGPVRRQAKALLAEALPVDMYFWYHGSMGMFQVGDLFPIWSRSVQQALVGLQHRADHAAGSWSPIGEHDRKGGRILTTALGLLSIEVYFRHSILDERPVARFAGPRAVVRVLPTVEDAKVRAALIEELGLMRSDEAVLACLSERAEKDPDEAVRAAAKGSLDAIRARGTPSGAIEEHEFAVDSRSEWSAAPFHLAPGEVMELTLVEGPELPLFARLGPSQHPVGVTSPFRMTADRFGCLFLGPGSGAATEKKSTWKVKATVRFAPPAGSK